MFIITGGGSGIGHALALELADRGQSVLVVGRREEPLADTAASRSGITYLSTDVSRPEGRQAVAEHLKEVRHIKGLIHNAGIIDPIAPINEIELSAWQQAMATNVEAPLFLTQLLSRQLSGGRVLNISSGAAQHPVAGWAAYCVSKAALSMLTRSFQLEVDTTFFTSVRPGIIDTPMQTIIRHASNMDSDKLDFFKSLKQKGQLIKPAAVAVFLSWLLLELSDSEFESKEWDIYDQSHHSAWLIPPHVIPPLE